MRVSFFDDCEIWPIQVRFSDLSGYSLWGPGGEDQDLVLAIGGQLPLFPTPDTLAAFVSEDHSSSLASLPGYKEIRRTALSFPERLWKSHLVVYRLDLLEQRLKSGPRNWDMGTAAMVCDGLSLLWDIAVTLGDEDIKAMLRAPAALGRLSDALSFVRYEDLPALLETVDWLAVARAGDTVVTTVRGRCCVVPRLDTPDRALSWKGSEAPLHRPEKVPIDRGS